MVENGKSPNYDLRTRIPIYEDGWFTRSGRDQTPVTREKFLRVLSSIDTILVRATLAQNMETTSLSRVNMDIAVPQKTGGPLALGRQMIQKTQRLKYFDIFEVIFLYSGLKICEFSRAI